MSKSTLMNLTFRLPEAKAQKLDAWNVVQFDTLSWRTQVTHKIFKGKMAHADV